MSHLLGHFEADSVVRMPSLVNNMYSISAMIKAMKQSRLTESEMKELVAQAISAMTDRIVDGYRVSWPCYLRIQFLIMKPNRFFSESTEE